MPKPTVFIGSSSGSVRIAESVRKGLLVRGCGDVQVWNQGIFGLNRGFLETLLEAVKVFDFAVLIWSADDAVNSKGQVQESPRDNVVFETGLFMGAMGRDRVFIVFDVAADLKIPSDFTGITLAEYDGVAFETLGYSAVQAACKKVAKLMSTRRLPQLVGEWKSRYCKAAYSGHSVIIDDVDIAESKGGVVITSRPRADAKSYSAHGRLSKPQQIVGEWQHEEANSFIEGLFVLTINQAADQMYGYCTARDETDALVFETWILAKKDGRSESNINEALLEGELTLRRRTLLETPTHQSVEQRNETKTRDVLGEWLSAVQPVYYETPKWHVQRIRVEPAELGFRIQTAKDPVKLQWEWTARLEGTKYLTGPWKSLRPGSESRGYMSVQLSSNGKYMLGHDYGAAGKHGNSDFGILLFGRTE